MKSHSSRPRSPWLDGPGAMTPPRPIPSWLAPRRKSAPHMEAVTIPRMNTVPPIAMHEHVEIERNPSVPPVRISVAPEASLVAIDVPACDCAARDAAIDVLHAELARALEETATMRATVLESAEGDLVKLAIAIARRVVVEELRTDPRLIERWAREARAALLRGDDVTVAIAPDVARSVPAASWTVAPAQVDPSLPAGGCEVRTADASADASLDGRFAAVVEALGEDP